MEEFATFIMWMIITHPIYYLMFHLGFDWVDFMSSLKVKSFFYTKFGLKFRTTERIQHFGTIVHAFLMSFVLVAIAFYPLIYLR
tara:strand:+ start:198 stop:449 length:252 start_codon:yes stop_codon:yes gene_type:complete